MEYAARLHRYKIKSGVLLILPPFRRGVFESDDVRLLAVVYEDVLKALGSADLKDPLREQIARKLIDWLKLANAIPSA